MNDLFVPFNPKGGRPRKFAYPSQLLTEFDKYVKDREQRAIQFSESENGVVGESLIKKEKVKIKHHPLSIVDFCIYLGCSRAWWNALPDEFLGVKNYISDYIFSYQLKGAEIGEFNANIVARELGLADKKEVSAGEGVTIIVKDNEQKDKLENMGNLGV